MKREISMKITELKDKIVIAELDPKKDYIILVNPDLVSAQSLSYVKQANAEIRKMPVLIVRDIDKAIRFIEVPKKND